MSWAKLDDAILDNPKIVAAGPLCFALYVAGITWSCRNLTDGFIPGDKVAVLINWNGVCDHVPLASDSDGDFVTGRHVSWAQLTDELVAEGLWSEVPRGYMIHDFLVYNRSKEQVLRERAAAKERKAGRSSGKVRRSSRGVRANSVVSSAPPVPVPVPSTEEADPPAKERKALSLASPPIAKAAPKKATQWPDDFTLTLARAEVARQLGVDAAGEWNKFRDHALKDGKPHKDWDAAWRYWCRQAPNFERRRM